VKALNRLPDDATVDDVDAATADALAEIIDVAIRLRSLR
jgi:hypothetical protein